MIRFCQSSQCLTELYPEPKSKSYCPCNNFSVRVDICVAALQSNAAMSTDRRGRDASAQSSIGRGRDLRAGSTAT